MISRTSSPRRRPANDAGFVMVPVMAMLALGLALAFVALALVDRQTAGAQENREADATEALAEGALSATANVLASDSGNARWRTAGCSTYNGSLTGASAAGTDPVAVAVENAVRASFRDRQSDDTTQATEYIVKGGKRATFTVNVCPTTDNTSTLTGGETRWSDTMLTRTGVTGKQAGLRTLWLRAQGNLRSSTNAGGTATVSKSRAAAEKIRQSGGDNTPPTDYAIGAASMSTDLSTTLSGLTTSGSVGSLLSTILGTKPVVTNSPDDPVAPNSPSAAKIGLRCGLLTGVKLGSGQSVNLNQTNLDLCLGGTLGGASSATSSLGLGAVSGLLGLDRFASLDSWSMTSSRTVQAYRDAANLLKTAGQTPGYGDNRTKNVTGTDQPCVTDTEWSTLGTNSIIYIDRVGKNTDSNAGSQYCTLSGTHQAKIIVVARGGVRVTGTFKGVVYGANLEECDPSGAASDASIDSCSSTARSAATSSTTDGTKNSRHEVVRVEAGGQVRGAVWADGAGGQVGLYPTALSTNSSVTGALLQNLDSTLCSSGAANGLVASLANLVGNLLTGVLNAVGTGNQEQLVPTGSAVPSGAPPTSTTQACGLFQGTLKALAPSSLTSFLGVGGTTPVGYEKYTRSCLLFICSAWTKVSSTTVLSLVNPANDQSLISQLLGTTGTLNAVVNALGATLSNSPPLVIRDATEIAKAKAPVSDSTTVVSGTFRSVPPTGVPGT
ncbi:hypothetical protein [Patulibacter minatonensis]|uniref:hypothetical protein n=1 Tax=Patulibacter minatonensis TaxID=298163 RepID=UPI00047A5641|nr:hypothetical protein [Patulibacter minatonensis]